MRIKAKKLTNRVGWFLMYGDAFLRDMGDINILFLYWEVRIWLKKPYYDHLEIRDNT